MAVKSPQKRDTLARARSLYIVAIIIVVTVFLRVLWLQCFSSDTSRNAEELHKRIFDLHELPAHRGSILDSRGEPLAVSIYKYQVQMDYGSEGFDSLKRFELQCDSLSKLLSRYFKDRPAKAYADKMKSDRQKHYVLRYRKDSSVIRSEGWWFRLLDKLQDREFKTIKVYDTLRNHKPVALLPREIDYTEWQELKKWPILNYNMGLTYNLSRTDSRVYPHDDLARQTIGKLYEGNGRDYGVESVCSLELAAHPGQIYRQRIARGFYGRVIEGENIDPEDGCDVYTTLDIDVQDVVSQALEDQLIRNRGIWGTSMVMEVETGNILAMANLERVAAGRYIENYNYAIKSRNEPGSTFKLASLLALLEEADMSPDQIYDSGNGALLFVGTARAQDAHEGYHEVDLRTATIHSLNGYYAKAVHGHYNSDPMRFTNFLRTLHLDRRVGLEEFGAWRPLFRDPDSSNWTHNNTIGYLGYGYAIELTPLHILTLYNAVANDGCMVAPRLIDRVEREGEVIRQTHVDVLNPKICSKKTLATVREYLEGVASEGTAKGSLSDFKEFKVGAKTGTAKIDQGKIKYAHGYYIGSMVSYMPADNPKYTVYTAIFTRQGYGAYSGAGLTGAAQQRIIQYLYNRDAEWYDTLDDAEEEQYPTRIKSGNVEQIRHLSYELSPNTAKHSGEAQWAKVSVDSLSKVKLSDVEQSESIMPNVVGMGLKDALFLLESRSLRVSFSGTGAVCAQSIKAGAKVSEGARVSIRLR